MNATQRMPGMTQGNKAAMLLGRSKLKPQDYSAALYLRLSRDEGENESRSIDYQRQMLTDYAEAHGYTIYDEYIDDGETGTNFNRTNFQRMIGDIEAGAVNMVLTKDLSRFGRNIAQAIHYRDDFFPKHGVRFISIDGKYDSVRDEENDFALLEDIFNEYYPKQVSRKVKKTRKIAAERGQFMGSIPPYGYRRSSDNRHKLVVDEEVSPIVLRIFEQFKNGDSARRIGDRLNREGILPPQAHYYHYMGKENPYGRNAKTWCSSTIMSLLQKDVYIGNITQGKRTKWSFKDETVVFLPKEDWITVEGKHEPIISQETFNTVQSLISSNKKGRQRKTSINNEVSLFSNLLRCADCGSKITMHNHTRNGKIQHRYRCSRYCQHGSCTPHQITLEILSDAVLKSIQENARLAKEDEDAFVKALYKLSRKEQSAEVGRCKKELAVAEGRLKEIDDLVKAVFEKSAKGSLPDDMLSMLLKGYGEEKTVLEAQLPLLVAALESASSQMADAGSDVEALKQHAEITDLTREVLTNLIRVIRIAEPVPNGNGKERDYSIEIRYKFQPPQTN